jgi:hypothetical protein
MFPPIKGITPRPCLLQFPVQSIAISDRQISKLGQPYPANDAIHLFFGQTTEDGFTHRCTMKVGAVTDRSASP